VACERIRHVETFGHGSPGSDRSKGPQSNGVPRRSRGQGRKVHGVGIGRGSSGGRGEEAGQRDMRQAFGEPQYRELPLHGGKEMKKHLNPTRRHEGTKKYCFVLNDSSIIRAKKMN